MLVNCLNFMEQLKALLEMPTILLFIFNIFQEFIDLNEMDLEIKTLKLFNGFVVKTIASKTILEKQIVLAIFFYSILLSKFVFLE